MRKVVKPKILEKALAPACSHPLSFMVNTEFKLMVEGLWHVGLMKDLL